MDDMDDIEDLLEAPYKSEEKSLAEKTASLDNNEVSKVSNVLFLKSYRHIFIFFFY